MKIAMRERKLLKKMHPSIAVFLVVLGISTGSVANAVTSNLTFVQNAFGALGNIINLAIPVLVALGVLFFIWGLVQFIFASGDESAKDEGKRKMIWGVIALFVIVSVWGLVALLNQVTGVTQGKTFQKINTTGATIPPTK
jgi:hypothetical protein